jgi:hypothetical protein
MENHTKLIVASSIAEIFTYPIDYVKTNIQDNVKVRSLNVSNMYKGVELSILRQSTNSILRVNCYNQLNSHLFDNSDSYLTKSVSGSISGGLSQLLISPIDLFKVQRQIYGKTYKEMFSAKNLKFKKIYHGSTPNVQRSVLVTIGDLSTYDYAFTHVTKNYPEWHFLTKVTCSSIVSGFVSSFLSNPADVVKTRMMSRPDKYKGTMQTFRTILKEEGLTCFYKGFLNNWSRLGPWNFIFWLAMSHYPN